MRYLQIQDLLYHEIRDLPYVPNIDKAVRVEVGVRDLGRSPVDDYIYDERDIPDIDLPVMVEVALRVDGDVFFFHGRVRAASPPP